jgi:acyl-CoA dehydrogenase
MTMDSTHALILNTAERILRDHCDRGSIDLAASGVWPAALWQTLEAAGLPLVSVPEALGGAGGTIGNGFGLLKVAARFAAPLPLAETFLAGQLLAMAGAAAPSGPLTVIPGDIDEVIRFDGTALVGRASWVPWAAQASALVVATADGVALVDPARTTIIPGQSMAGEPRDTVIFDGTACAFHPIGDVRGRLFQLGALTRAVMMAGALEAVLAMTVQYVKDRKQFGQALARFQAVQQSLAVMAGQATAAASAAGMAVSAIANGDGAIEIAVAKARAGEAAGIASELAHQAHGAIGFTREYALHQYTRRLWCWRDEFGGEPYWQAELGRHVATAGKARLWEFTTRSAG